MIHIRYYVLRDDMLAFYISDLKARLSKNEHGSWEVSRYNWSHRMINAILRQYRRSRQRFTA